MARVPEIQGCHTQGKTVSEVLERIKEAIEVCLEYNIPITFIGMRKIEV